MVKKSTFVSQMHNKLQLDDNKTEEWIMRGENSCYLMREETGKQVIFGPVNYLAVKLINKLRPSTYKENTNIKIFSYYVF